VGRFFFYSLAVGAAQAGVMYVRDPQFLRGTNPLLVMGVSLVGGMISVGTLYLFGAQNGSMLHQFGILAGVSLGLALLMGRPDPVGAVIHGATATAGLQAAKAA